MKKEVLACFRQLHKTRKLIFNGDDFALQEARKRINEEFKKHKSEIDVGQIRTLLATAKEADLVLRTNVVQVKLNAKGNYEVQINKDTELFDNLPINNK